MCSPKPPKQTQVARAVQVAPPPLEEVDAIGLSAAEYTKNRNKKRKGSTNTVSSPSSSGTGLYGLPVINTGTQITI